MDTFLNNFCASMSPPSDEMLPSQSSQSTSILCINPSGSTTILSTIVNNGSPPSYVTQQCQPFIEKTESILQADLTVRHTLTLMDSRPQFKTDYNSTGLVVLGFFFTLMVTGFVLVSVILAWTKMKKTKELETCSLEIKLV